VDVEGGRQPVSNEDGTVWAAQNGELYNFSPPAAGILLARGHRFASRCDTETLPHLYEEHGAELATKIDGMFAVAVWDDARKVGDPRPDRMGRSRSITIEHRGRALFRLGDQGAPPHIPGSSAASTWRRSITT
jgi:asparagine synthase (glutamine-hydrolysing)